MNFFSEPLHFLNGSQYDLNFYMKSIMECEKMEEPLQLVSTRVRTLSLLSHIYFLQTNNTVKPVILDERIRKVLKYLDDNLRNEISLNVISEKFSITKNHLNMLFRETVGTTIMKYISIKRLGLARQEITSGASIKEAAYHSGFNDYSSFFRAYKSFYGMAPSKLSPDGIDFLDP